MSSIEFLTSFLTIYSINYDEMYTTFYLVIISPSVPMKSLNYIK